MAIRATPPPRGVVADSGARSDVEPTCINSKRDCDGRLRSAIWTAAKREASTGLSTRSDRLVFKHIVSRREFNVAYETVRHPNIVLYHSRHEYVPGEHWVVMDYCQGKTLSDVIEDWKQRSSPSADVDGAAAVSLPRGGQRDVLSIMTQLLAAVEHLHVMCKLVHRDIKPDNIIVGSDGHVTVIDLDLVKLIAGSHHVDTGMHTPGYAAPERLQVQPTCTAASDMWSVGCILYELIALRLPFPPGHVSPFLPLLCATTLHRQKMFDEEWLTRISRLTTALLQKQPADRPTVVTVLRHLGRSCEFPDFDFDSFSGGLNDETALSPHLPRAAVSTGARSGTGANGFDVKAARQQLALAYQSTTFRYMDLSVPSDDKVEPLNFHDVFVLLHVAPVRNGSEGAPNVAAGKEVKAKVVPRIADAAITSSNGRSEPGEMTFATRKDIRAKQVPGMAADHNQRLVLIEADAGWGKSTMLRDLARTQDDSDACGFLIVHADLRTVLEMPPVTAAGSQSQLYSHAADGAVRMLADYLTASRLNDDVSRKLLSHLLSRDRADPVVWLFDALDEVSANPSWNPAVQAILTRKVADNDIVVFTARPNRSDRVQSSGWDAMRLAVRRWSPSDVEKYITAFASQVTSSAAEKSKCESTCRSTMDLLASTEFEAVPLFCELACYHAAIRDGPPPVSIASMFEAVLKAVLRHDIRKHLGTQHRITATMLSSHIDSNHPRQLQRAFEAAEAVGWAVVSMDETGWINLTDDEASALLPSALAIDVARSLNLNLTSWLTAGAHNGWLAPEPTKVRNRYTFLRKLFAEYMAFRRLKGHFEARRKLPRMVTLEPRWHVPLSLLADDVAATCSRIMMTSSASILVTFVRKLRRLLKAAMTAPPAQVDDFFGLYREDAAEGWVPRRFPAFARSGYAACVRQIVAVLHVVHRTEARITPRDAINAAASKVVDMLTIRFASSRRAAACRRIFVDVDDRWSEIVTVHALIQAVGTGDAAFVKWLIDANDMTKRAAAKYGDALWAAVQTAAIRSNERGILEVLRVFTDDARVTVCSAAAAGDIQLVRSKLQSTDVTSEELFLAAEQCINGGLWRDVRDAFEQSMIAHGIDRAEMPDGWLSYLTQAGDRGAHIVDVSGLLKCVDSLPHGFGQNSPDLRYVGSRDANTVASILSPGVYLIIGDGPLAVELAPLTFVGDEFLDGCTGLTALDPTPLAHLTSVGQSFLAGCTGLTALDLTPLAHLTSVGGAFLRGCTGLTVLDLTPLEDLASAGHELLCGCTGLAELHLTPLTSLGSWFLRGCSNLTVLDLTPLAQMASLDDGFLYGCTGLTELDLAPLALVTSVGGGFLSLCTGLTKLVLTPLVNLRSVADMFLRGCSGLTVLDLTSLARLTTVGDGFLAECSRLTALNLTSLSHLSCVGDEFLRGCSGLTVLDLRPLAHLTSVGDGFLAQCTGLTELHLTLPARLTSVGDSFLRGCTRLTVLDLTPFTHLSSVGHGFLAYCTRLTELTLTPLACLTSVGDSFLNGCTGLTALDLTPLGHLDRVGRGFLANCTSLRELVLPGGYVTTEDLSVRFESSCGRQAVRGTARRCRRPS